MRVGGRARTGSEHSKRLVAHLPAMAIGTMQEVTTPPLTRTPDVRQQIAGTRREKQPARAQRTAAGQLKHEAFRSRDDPIVEKLDAVAPQLRATGHQKIGRRHSVTRQETLHVRRRCIARRAGVDHSNSAPRPTEHQSGAQTGSPAADHKHVIVVRAHGSDTARARPLWPDSLLFLGNGSSVLSWSTSKPSRMCSLKSDPA